MIGITFFHPTLATTSGPALSRRPPRSALRRKRYARSIDVGTHVKLGEGVSRGMWTPSASRRVFCSGRRWFVAIRAGLAFAEEAGAFLQLSDHSANYFQQWGGFFLF